MKLEKGHLMALGGIIVVAIGVFGLGLWSSQVKEGKVEEIPTTQEEETNSEYQKNISEKDMWRFDGVARLLFNMPTIEENKFIEIVYSLDGKVSPEVQEKMLDEYNAYKLAGEIEVWHPRDNAEDLEDYSVLDDYEWPLYNPEGQEVGATNDVDDYIKNQKEVFNVDIPKEDLISKSYTEEEMKEDTKPESEELVPSENSLHLADGTDPNMIAMYYKQYPTNEIICYKFAVENDVIVDYILEV